MKISHSADTNSIPSDNPEKTLPPKSSFKESKSNSAAADDGVDERSKNGENESVLDVTGKSLEFDTLEKADGSVERLYFYKNAFSLVPRSVVGLGSLKALKFFGNKVDLFPPEFGNLVALECLQVKMSAPGLNGFALNKLQGLKELELSRVPPRASVLTIFSEISGLKCLTKLSVCHFSIRYLPPEISCLNKLEFLDLSFNKIKVLPTEICSLNALISLKVANNKLVEIPSGLTLLQRLENLDLSSNRLTSLGSLELGLMRSLQYLNLQYNKLLSCCQMPSWICCNLEGNGKDLSNDDFFSSSVEMDVYETSIQEDGDHFPCNGSHQSCMLTSPSSNIRCFASRKSSKRWKRRQYLQQRARQERLNNSRKWKGEGHTERLRLEMNGKCKSDDLNVLTYESRTEGTLDIIGLDDNDDKVVPQEAVGESVLISVEDNNICSKSEVYKENSSSDLTSISKAGEDDSCVQDEISASTPNGADGHNEVSSSKIRETTYKSKRHSDRTLDNPKPCKCRRPPEDSLGLSQKYSDFSFCSIDEYLPDGFYDAGRDRPFMPLKSYKQILKLDSREVILLDRDKDEELDSIVLSAQALLRRLVGFSRERNKFAVDDLHTASLLALFVSDHFGGSDKSSTIEKARKAVSGLNYRKPFVCTCSTGNNDSISTSNKQIVGGVEDIVFSNLCEKSLSSIKARRGSIIVPLGALQFGICRHRALLMKYLCDRLDPPMPCELVRGYLDFMPHAWNIIPVKRGHSFVRMVVDTCCPHDIREETDPEYFCRYVPLSRTRVPLLTESIPVPGSFPSLSHCDEVEAKTSSTLIRCKFGSIDAAAKVRTLEVSSTSVDEIRNFEYNCLGEVRLLGVLQHPCIVEMYGHQISTKWSCSKDGNTQRRVLQSAILMEYVKGGSLKNYIEKLSKIGEKHVPVELALYIARDVVCALAELHSKHIIHRDIKSENILIDLDSKQADGIPIVKLCDFDRAVPLRSLLHTCCIAHKGIAPPDVCVGTPRWMAPEVLRTMHKREIYGLEVDIWSYGCLLLELLTLQVPYSGVPELHIHELLQMGKRPQLTDNLEALGSMNDPTVPLPDSDLESPEAEAETLRFLIDLYRQCTVKNPADRPTAMDIYQTLVERTSTLTLRS